MSLVYQSTYVRVLISLQAHVSYAAYTCVDVITMPMYLSGAQQLQSELDSARKQLADMANKCDELSAENIKVVNLHHITLQDFCPAEVILIYFFPQRQHSSDKM